MASGQCYGCGTTFGIFRKEHGCKNCGFAFCSRCLPKSIEVPKYDNAKHHVCNRCHEILTGKADREREKERERKAAPDAYYKRMAALHEGTGAPSYNYGMSYSYTPTSNKSSIPPQYRGLSRVDADIAMRLDKLKEKNQPLYSERDISDRLSKLKGSKPGHAPAYAPKKTQFYHPPDRRPQQKQVEDLLDEICDEVEIDTKFDPAKDIEDRLVRFKDEPPRKDIPAKKTAAGNNLNTASSGPNKSYTKNIRSVSGARASRELTLDDVNTLISSMAKEMEVDAQKAVEDLQKDKEIMERLNEIKKKKTAKGEGSEEDNEEQYEDSDDEELAAKKIIKQYLEEVKLEERLGDIPSIDGQPTEAELKKMNTDKPKKSTDKGKDKGEKAKKKISEKTGGTVPDVRVEDEDEFDPDELPYCCICTNDATIRCLGCDFDLYCAGCFKEGHDKLDMNDHVTVKYTPPKESS